MKTHAIVPVLVAALAASAAAQDVLVVAPKDFHDSLAAWTTHRAKQGLAVAVREPSGDVGAIVREVSEKSGKKLRFVMLVGDADEVPCATRERKGGAIMGMEGAEPDIATDDPFADLDGDGVPDLAIGRVPADSPADAKAYLDRVVAYETDTDFGSWRERLNVVAGTGGFGPMVDMALETLCRQLLAENVPPAVEVTMTYASPLSPFCPPPAEFADYAVKRWSEGALVVAYVGHGSERAVDRIRSGKDVYPILDLAHVAKIDSARGAPVSMFIACSTGHFDGERDCLAEELLKRPRGPVAVIASSRVSSPYSNGIVAKELLDALFKTEVATTGELLVAMKRRLVEPAAGDARRDQLEKMAAAMFERDPEKRRLDREDHLFLYNLLGDPCVRIARPAHLDVAAPATVAPGKKFTVTGTAPFGGELSVVVERGRKAPVKPAITVKKTPEDYRSVYEAANSRVILQFPLTVKAGPFSVELTIPADAAPGACAVRVYLAGKSGAAAGGAEVTLAVPETK